MAAACGANESKIDFKCLRNEQENEISPYFLIGEQNASESELETLCDRMKAIAKTIILHDPEIMSQREYYHDFDLPNNFKGFALLVQDDGAGMNVLQTYQAIQAVAPLDVKPSAYYTASVLAADVWNRQQETPGYLNLQPHLEGIKELAKELKSRSETVIS